VLSSTAFSHGQQQPPKSKLEANYKYQLHSPATLLIDTLFPCFRVTEYARSDPAIPLVLRLFKLLSHMAAENLTKWTRFGSDEEKFKSDLTKRCADVTSRCDALRALCNPPFGRFIEPSWFVV
jgi:hypothetical protein